MRTSNKILLGTFLATVLIITGIHVALKAKIDSGKLVELRKLRPQPSLEKHELPGVKHVRFSDIGHCIVYVSDTSYMELGKQWKEHLSYRIAGDSLVVEVNNKRDQSERVHMPMVLHLPDGISISASNSAVSLYGANDSAKAISRMVSGDDCQINVWTGLKADQPGYWKNLSVSNSEGMVEISSPNNVEALNLSLRNSAMFVDHGARFGSVALSIDSTCSVNLRAGSLEKLSR